MYRAQIKQAKKRKKRKDEQGNKCHPSSSQTREMNPQREEEGASTQIISYARDLGKWAWGEE